MSDEISPLGAIYNEATGVWELLNKDEVAKARAFAGEQSMGFYFGERGYFIVEGPSGHGGHNQNAKGLDGVAYHPGKKELLIYDNKALRESGNVSKASATTDNLEENLERLIKGIEKRAGLPGTQAMPHGQAILRNLKQALKAAKSGKGWPKNVKLQVYNASGQASGVTKRLDDAGIKFIEYHELSKVRGRPWQRNPLMKATVEEISKRARKLEFEAAQQISEKERQRISQRVARGVKSHAVLFAEKRMPKIITKFVMSASAKRAAKRAASLVPLAGWAFAGHDAYKGLEDILRGNVARGLAGIGLAGADVASDFLHLGDAISGVGGTALSLGAQAGTIAGQVTIEVNRLKDKLQQLNEEIAKNSALPPDNRLRDEYDLDDEEIKELKDEFNKRDEEPEPPMELPPPPKELFHVPPPVYRHEPTPEPPPPKLPQVPQRPLPRPSPSPPPKPVPHPGKWDRNFPSV